jgi:SAM-dependent methyltransferase
MKECSKSIQRRLHDPNFLTKYFRGVGIDIGGAPDPLALYADLFPLIQSIRTWDLPDGDAQILGSISDASFDFVHSSHCLEHMVDPAAALENWLRIVKPNGYLVITVPEEDLYEQGVFPSTYNRDHKWTFTIKKAQSWSPRSVNVLDLVGQFCEVAEIIKIELLDATYHYALPRFDQTLTPVTESAIEVILRKRSGDDPSRALPATSAEIRIHLNQYKEDMETLKRANRDCPPFRNSSGL